MAASHPLSKRLITMLNGSCTERRVRKDRKTKLVFVMTGACALTGGIATLNRNILRSLIDLAHEYSIDLHVLSFLESAVDRPDWMPAEYQFRPFQGSKVRITLAMWRLALQGSLFVFDHVTLSVPILPAMISSHNKVIMFAHGSEAWRELRPTSRWAYRCADLCLAVSCFTLKKMREMFSGFRAVVCPLGLSPDFKCFDTPPESVYPDIRMSAVDGHTYALTQHMLLLVGRMHPKQVGKGHELVMQAVSLIGEKYPKLQAVFAGEGDDRSRLEAFAHEQKIANKVFFCGAVSTEELKILYQSCYAFVMPSRQEGFGLVYLEAMSYAKPCIGCWDDGAEEVIIDGETGFLIHDPKDPHELARVLDTILKHPAEANRLGMQGFARLRTHFTSAQVQQRIKQHLLKIFKFP